MMFKLILTKNSGPKFTLLTNSEQKQWLIPHKNMRTALQIYQPSALKGKVTKACLPQLKALPSFLLTKVNINTVYSELNPILKSFLCKVFLVPDLEFSVFFGTPSIHQKTTLQISFGKKILGYCKVTDNPEVNKLFLHEQKMLDELNKKKLVGVPECLYCGSLQFNTWLFVQSTKKTFNSKIIHKWTNKHYTFLTHLYDKSKKEYFFSETDLSKSLDTIENFLEKVPDRENIILRRGIKKVRDFYGEGTVEFSSYLADFTPWNTYIEGDTVEAFDLEYSRVSYPPYMDFYHFNTQVLILEKNYDFLDIYTYCEKESKDTFLEIDFSVKFICYLLTVISFHFDINSSPLRDNDRCYNRWLALIEFSLTKCEAEK